MKRFRANASLPEDPCGSFVLADDAERELANLRAVVSALPVCDICRVRPAKTQTVDADRYVFCDHCSGPPDATPLPYAEALRALEKP
jgi:hypothetical protein